MHTLTTASAPDRQVKPIEGRAPGMVSRWVNSEPSLDHAGRSVPGIGVAATGLSGATPDAVTPTTFVYDFSRVPVRGAVQRMAAPGDRSTGMAPNNTSGEGTTPLPDPLRAGLETLSGIDLSGVLVHRNSARPTRLNALAYASGENIYLGPGEERHLPHEGWHVVQQMQGRVRPSGPRLNDLPINDEPHLESEADQMGTRAAVASAGWEHQPAGLRSVSPGSGMPAQRQVRINGGATRVAEAGYRLGGVHAAVGSRHSVRAMINDNVRRVFNDVAELEDYANGQLDYIGDVATTSAGTFWYRLPQNRLTVLGEVHENPAGNFEDVVRAFRTHRFMYEPFNEMVAVAPINIPFTGTQTRLDQVNNGIEVASEVDRANFNPDLENIVVKALTGATIVRNEYIAANPRAMNAVDRQQWQGRPSTSDYSYGERAALYLSMGIHLANDLANGNTNIPATTPLLRAARGLQRFYIRHQAVLDQLMNAKDADDLIGIYELTSPGNFANLHVVRDFTLALHEYGARYIEQLGRQTGNSTLRREGGRLAHHRRGNIDSISPAREEIMWEKIQQAITGGYLIVGMGDAHHQNLAPRLTAAGIAHEEVTQSLARQAADVNAGWVP
ncbi:MAG: DUF4157 domain-containing protein [Candidatus Kapaibacterium sp.]